MIFYAQLLSPLVGTGTPVVDPKRPQFFDDYPDISSNDVTYQTFAPPPFCIVIEAMMDEEQYSIVSSDENYQILKSSEVDSL